MINDIKSMSDLAQFWKENAPRFVSELDPITLRRVVAAKDSRKLDLAMDGLKGGQEGSMEHIVATATAMLCGSSSLKPAWEELADGDLSDTEAPDVTEAFFLFVLDRMRRGTVREAVDFWESSSRRVGRHLPRDAVTQLERVLRGRVKEEAIEAFRKAKGE